MEANLRNILIIISAIAIVAIFIHGLWTIRKNKNPYKLKTNKQQFDQDDLEDNVDSSGFDRFGVGQVKVKTQVDTDTSDSTVENEILADTQKIVTKSTVNVESEPQPENPTPEESIGTTDDFSLSAIDLSETNKMSLTQTIILDKKGIREELSKLRDEHIGATNMYQEPVTRAKPARANKGRAISKTVTCELSKEELKRNQMEINFGDASVALEDEYDAKSKSEPTLSGSEPTSNSASTTHSAAITKRSDNNNPDAEVTTKSKEQLVIALSVVMPEGQQMMGASLLPMLLTLGLKYGDLNIFHRHQDNAGNGDVRFSLVNMLNPGTFDLDSMETFATPGVSLFMALPCAGDPFADFDQMLSAAKHIAQAFNAQVIDDKRNVMTKQTEQHYVGKIREFDRQHRLASVE